MLKIEIDEHSGFCFGVTTAINIGYETTGFLQIFVGVLTGVGGGVLRDIMAGNTPYIFVKHSGLHL